MRLDDIDVVSGAAYLDGPPHEQFSYLREHAPVFHQQVPDPELVDEVWVLTRAAEVRQVSEDPDTFSSKPNVALRARQTDAGLRAAAGNFINQDDPQHRRLRSMVAKAFTPRVVATFTEHYRALTADVIAKALPQGEFDFVTEVAAELPLLAICELLGAPISDRSRIFRWTNAILGSDDPEYGGGLEEAGRAIAELGRYALELADAKRAAPGDDIVSALATAPPGQRLSDPEYEGFILLLLLAGNETTRNNISHGIVALTGHPEQLTTLRADPERLNATVEEITRWASPVNFMSRTATRDTELGGQRIRVGDRVAMFYSSANRDPAMFPGGEVFDIGHRYDRHLAFGIGRHFCLGAHLARVETRAVLAELMATTDDIRVTGPVIRQQSSFLNGIKHLPVAVTPRTE
ncbi:cytochrome P450 [Pseudonocardia spinosispora]|uniref:cytochrome P450 n=1 Tax=Pseudonocardia spinosispora TaxID=103441 RepID=UPI00040DA009|nr:cytochrome P450 [Pseudonocardia spinosispora]